MNQTTTTFNVANAIFAIALFFIAVFIFVYLKY